MATALLDVTVKGLIETQRALEQISADLHGQPMLDAMHQATLLVERDAKINAPVDTGHLRTSISSEVRVTGQGGKDVQGIVGSPVTYAPAVETGTKPHFPPVGALTVWAGRHGMNPYLVARAISRRGTKGSHYLQRSFDKNQPRILDILGFAVTAIVEKGGT